jgi:hypothetical protein
MYTGVASDDESTSASVVDALALLKIVMDAGLNIPDGTKAGPYMYIVGIVNFAERVYLVLVTNPVPSKIVSNLANPCTNIWVFKLKVIRT